MLVLSRKLLEKIILSNGVKITVVAIKGNCVRLGIEAPRDVTITREELFCKDAQHDAASIPVEAAEKPRTPEHFPGIALVADLVKEDGTP